MDDATHDTMHAHEDEREDMVMGPEEEDTRSEHLRTLGLGLLLGAVIGAGAALLLAPDSGTVTRKRLRRGAQRLARTGSAAVTDWWDDADREARRLLRRKMRRGRKIVEGWRG
ncbi:MAG: YtxH domain-containing protein [Gemmatimonadaceae bacterium]|nr:YtxH domain-containing protein [Gemmatimonadaceae bacterium]